MSSVLIDCHVPIIGYRVVNGAVIVIAPLALPNPPSGIFSSVIRNCLLQTVAAIDCLRLGKHHAESLVKSLSGSSAFSIPVSEWHAGASFLPTAVLTDAAREQKFRDIRGQCYFHYYHVNI